MLLLALAVAACQAAAPSTVPSASPQPTSPSPIVGLTPSATADPGQPAATNPPSPSPPATAPVSVSPLDLPRGLVVPASAIVGAPLVTQDQWLWATSGTTIAYRASDGGRHWWIELLDVSTGQITKVPGSNSNGPMIESFDTKSLVWLQDRVRYSPGEDATPGGNGNANHWQILSWDFASAAPVVLVEGVNHWITDDSYVHDPYVAIDGDLMAYDIETPGTGKKAEIVVQSMSNGDVKRVIDVGGPVFDVQLSGADVTYTTGKIAHPAWDSPEDPIRILSPADGPSRELPAEEPFESVENGMTLGVDFSKDTGPGSIDPVYVTADGVRKQVGIWNLSGRLSHGDGLFGWVSEYGPAYADTDAVTLYDTFTRRLAALDVPSGGGNEVRDLIDINDDWLFWTTMNEDSTNPDVHALRTADVHAAFEALADGK